MNVNEIEVISKHALVRKGDQREQCPGLGGGVFTWKDPRKIALSLKQSAESSTRRKALPFRSAMSMLVFYINRAGSKLDKDRLSILEQSKEELRILYGKKRHK